MTDISLNNEEKQHLERILNHVDEELHDAQNNEEGTNEYIEILLNSETFHNGFHFEQNDKKRLDEINYKLESSSFDTGSLKSSRSYNDETVWTNSILEQMLNDIDLKLKKG